jgi:hypothetical protein
MAGAFSSGRGLLPSHPLNNPTNRESASFSVFELKYDLIRSRISFLVSFLFPLVSLSSNACATSSRSAFDFKPNAP